MSDRRTLFLALLLSLVPTVAAAKDLCIQHDDNGDVLVVKGVGKGSKSVSGYFAEFLSIVGDQPVYGLTPLAGSALKTSDADLFVGLTQYGIGRGGFSENIAFHRVRCSAGADDKLGVSDSCFNIVKNTDNLPKQESHSGHLVDCIPALSVP